MNRQINKRKLAEYLISIIFDSDESSDSDCENYNEPLRKKRKFWVHPYYMERNTNGAFTSVYQSMDAIGDPHFFLSYLRMTAFQFEELLGIVGPFIEKEILIREPISAKMRLVITLR